MYTTNRITKAIELKQQVTINTILYLKQNISNKRSDRSFKPCSSLASSEFFKSLSLKPLFYLGLDIFLIYLLILSCS